MNDKERDEWKDNLWRYENVGACIEGEYFCLKCLTEEEKGRATEDATPDYVCRDIYIDDTELGCWNIRCERCGKELLSQKRKLEMIEKGRA